MNNYSTNQRVFGAIYSKTAAEWLAQQIEDPGACLENLKRSNISWVGIYHDDFQQRLRGTRILELGAGNGLNSLLMAKFGAEQVVAVEIVKESGDLIRKAAHESGLSAQIEVLIGDFSRLDILLESFDFVVGKAFLHHLTHEVEDEYLEKITRVIHPSGEARFFEPAINSQMMDTIRWIMPVPGRPSKLNKLAFAEWKQHDAHPERDDSSAHYRAIGLKYFQEVQILPIGGIERFHRLLPGGEIQPRFREWAFGIEGKLPYWLQVKIARSQTIIMRTPRNSPE